MRASPASWRPRRLVLIAVMSLAALYLLVAVYNVYKPLPPGIDVATPYRAASELRFLSDSTWLDDDGVQHSEQQIFDAANTLISQAQSTVLVDFFLINAFAGESDSGQRPLSQQLVDTLVRQKRQDPDLKAMLVSDPFNTLYGGVQQPLFDQLRDASVAVVVTDLHKLRDPNPLWSAAWRLCCQWFGNSSAHGWLPNPVGGDRVSLRSYLALFNLKANHRKTLIADTPQGWTALVTSANPHDASSRHDNIAVQFSGPAALDLLQTEIAVARFSSPGSFEWPLPEIPASAAASHAEIRILTESRIRDAALEMIDVAAAGDQVDMLMFYLSHRDVVRALLGAQQRGVSVRVILDPNRDAFGREKNGIPNRQVALELHQAGVPVRWCNTRGEQCHAKMLLRRNADDSANLLAGSANFTRRNLDNFNLETNVQVRAALEDPFMTQAADFFDTRWNNEPDRIHSLPYEAFADASKLRYWQYRFMEFSGLSAF